MSLIVCLECNAEVPDSSENCPECGFPFDSLTPVECPECKNLVVFSSDLCPSCGFPYEKLKQQINEGTVAHGVPAAEAGDGDEKAGAEIAAAQDQDQDQDQEPSEPLPEVPQQAEAQPAAPVVNSGAGSNNPIDNEYIVNSIINYITEVKVDIINKPIKAFVQILTELDKSNKELHTTLLQQGESAAAGIQEQALAIVSEIARLTTEQNREALTKSQEIAVTIVSEINAAASTLKEANSAATADLSNTMKEIAAKPAAATAAATSETSTESKDNNSEYILYLCIGMLVFTMLNFFITIYAVKLMK